MSSGGWAQMKEHLRKAQGLQSDSAEELEQLLLGTEELLGLAEVDADATVNEKEQNLLLKTVELRVLRRVCFHAARTGNRSFLERLAAQLEAGAPLAQWIGEYVRGERPDDILIFTHCALAAVSASERDSRSMVDSLQRATATLTGAALDPSLQIVRSAKDARNSPDDDAVTWLLDACHAMYARLADKGWAAMAVLDLTLDLMEKPRPAHSN